MKKMVTDDREISNECLFITVTLDPSQYVFKAHIQHETALNLLSKIFLNRNTIYVCVGELTKAYNMHYHIMLLDSTPRKNYKYYWKNKFRRDSRGRLSELGFTKIDTLHNDDARFKAYKYMMKDVASTQSLLNNVITSRLNDFWGDVIKGYKDRLDVLNHPTINDSIGAPGLT